MAKSTTLTAEDIKLIDKLRKQLFATHGTLTTAALIRMALRKLDVDLVMDKK